MRCLALLLVVGCGRTDLFPPVGPDTPPRVPPPVDAGSRDGGRADAGRADAGLPADAGFDGGVVDPSPWVPKPCLPGRAPLERTVPIVVFVLDASGSMAEPFDTNTKGTVLKGAMQVALPSWDPWMELGLVTFPTNPECIVVALPEATAPRRGQLPELLKWLGGQDGKSPTADAIRLALATLAPRRAANASRHVVLVTDGFPNCNAALPALNCRCQRVPCLPEDCLDDRRTIEVVREGARQGLPTWVLGVDTDDAGVRDVLDGLAVAGGRQRPFPGGRLYGRAVDGNSLGLLLRETRDRILRCSFFTRAVPPATGTFTVFADGRPLPESDSAGWAWVDVANGELALFGSACEQQLSATPPRLEAEVRCGP